MKKTSSLFAALLVSALCSGIVPFAQSSARAEEAQEAKKEYVRAEMGKAITEIQDLTKNKDYKTAAEKLEAQLALPNLTDYERFALSRTRALIASGTNDTEGLASSFDEMIKSGRLTKPEQLRLMEAMAGTYFNEKKYPKSIEWSHRYLALEPGNETIRQLVGRALYLQNDFAGAIKMLNAILADDDRAQKKPDESVLRLLGASYQQTKDNSGYANVLERMVTHYPSKEYWADLIYRVEHKPGFSDRLRLDLYRLLVATGNMEEAPQYVEMTELAMLAGLPAEAKKVVDAGFAVNMLGAGKDAAKHKQLRERIHKQASEDLKTLDAGETAAKSAKSGTGLVNIGYNYVLNGQFDKGLGLMEQGIAKGSLKSVNEAQLHLGMAYLQAGKRDKAAEVFHAIGSGDGAADLGRLWLLVPQEAAAK